MKRIAYLLFFLPLFLQAQPSLLPHIGLSQAPQPGDPVCNIPVYQGDMDSSGYHTGDTVPDFTLYKTNGDSVRLADMLSSGLPVLLVGGNYTCPVFRNRLNDLNSMANFYNGLLQVFVVYTVEAHPIIDPSPYSGQVWVTSQNQTDGVLYRQPTTYGERLALVDSMTANHNIVPEILVDGPCNEWWSNYGPAPNNAYLIDTNGIVSAKQGWFHKPPSNMWCEIDSLLGTTSGNCGNAGYNGQFTLTLDSLDSTAYGNPMDVLAIHVTLTNTSSTDNVEIRVQKLWVNVPTDWQTALCADVCYSPTVDSVDLVLGPNTIQPFTFYFYTGMNPDSGYANVGFRNNYNNQNRYRVTFGGITEEVILSLDPVPQQNWQIFPIPSGGQFQLTGMSNWVGERLAVHDLSGRLVYDGTVEWAEESLDLTHLEPGIYLLQVGSEAIETRKLVIR